MRLQREWLLRLLAMTAEFAGILICAYNLAWLLRFDFALPANHMEIWRTGLLLVACVKLPLYISFGFYRPRGSVYRSLPDLLRVLQVDLLASALATIAILLAVGIEFPRSVYCLDLLLSGLLNTGVLFQGRLRRELRLHYQRGHASKRVLIYGAGVAGVVLAREIRNNEALRSRVVGFLDDDPNKTPGKLLGLPVFGPGASARAVVESLAQRGEAVDEILVAMPSATSSQVRQALAKGRAAGVPAKLVPGLGELISGKVSLGRSLETSVSDLLGRSPVELDMTAVARQAAGRAVLVTGAAGSIGRELCSQLAGFDIRKLVAFDQAESELFHLEAMLRAKHPQLKLVTFVGDIRDPGQIEQVIESHGVDTIYHAAAYKHVPLMERQVCEAVRNNVLGTWNLVQAAVRHQVTDFLMISSDKAVNPTSVMGMTKRIGELMVSAVRPSLSASGRTTNFVSVRFGNVLVSNGSVVPIFQQQIASGGPVTVTHPNIRRYFMTVQEAVQLVLQALTLGKGSEVFVLDMGKPVKVLDLAHKMIAQAGLVPGEDIEIHFTGLRPGEKLFEEISIKGENMMPTPHSRISVFLGCRLDFAKLAPWVAELEHLLWRRDTHALMTHLVKLVPEYQGSALAPEQDTAAATSAPSASGSLVPRLDAAAAAAAATA